MRTFLFVLACASCLVAAPVLAQPPAPGPSAAVAAPATANDAAPAAPRKSRSAFGQVMAEMTQKLRESKKAQAASTNEADASADAVAMRSSSNVVATSD